MICDQVKLRKLIYREILGAGRRVIPAVGSRDLLFVLRRYRLCNGDCESGKARALLATYRVDRGLMSFASVNV